MWQYKARVKTRSREISWRRNHFHEMTYICCVILNLALTGVRSAKFSSRSSSAGLPDVRMAGSRFIGFECTIDCILESTDLRESMCIGESWGSAMATLAQ